jgi:hypothetical protein
MRKVRVEDSSGRVVKSDELRMTIMGGRRALMKNDWRRD